VVVHLGTAVRVGGLAQVDLAVAGKEQMETVVQLPAQMELQTLAVAAAADTTV
jgi:hypothetical protein